jgi:hypothetical protein
MAKEMISELRYKNGTPMRKYNSPKLQEIEMENKQTAVEWLFEKLWDEPKDKFTWYALREKAKQMENERLLDKYGEGYDEGMYDALNK